MQDGGHGGYKKAGIKKGFKGIDRQKGRRGGRMEGGGQQSCKWDKVHSIGRY
jgi:hypothetical protein